MKLRAQRLLLFTRLAQRAFDFSQFFLRGHESLVPELYLFISLFLFPRRDLPLIAVPQPQLRFQLRLGFLVLARLFHLLFQTCDARFDLADNILDALQIFARIF